LYGQLHVTGYDWVDRQQHTAQLAADNNLDVDGVAILGPDHGGNMHRLTAVTDVAILDVLAPAYDPKGGVYTAADVWLGNCQLSSFRGAARCSLRTGNVNIYVFVALQAETALTTLSYRMNRRS
jgi:PCO_ADO